MTSQRAPGPAVMDPDQVWQVIDAQRVKVAALLEQLSPGEWAQPSLCAGWTVRDVAAHLTLQQLGLPGAIAMMARWRGSLDRTIHAAACRRAPPGQLTRSLPGSAARLAPAATTSASLTWRRSPTYSSTGKTSPSRSAAATTCHRGLRPPPPPGSCPCAGRHPSPPPARQQDSGLPPPTSAGPPATGRKSAARSTPSSWYAPAASPLCRNCPAKAPTISPPGCPRPSAGKGSTVQYPDPWPPPGDAPAIALSYSII